MLFHLEYKPAHPVLKYMTSENAAQLLDTTLITKDGEVQCHAAVVLSKMSFLDQQKKENYCVILPDFTRDDVEKMLSFCYTGRAPRKKSEALSNLLVALNYSNYNPRNKAEVKGSNLHHGDHKLIDMKASAVTKKPPAVTMEHSAVGRETSDAARELSTIARASSVTRDPSAVANESSVVAKKPSSVAKQAQLSAAARQPSPVAKQAQLSVVARQPSSVAGWQSSIDEESVVREPSSLVNVMGSHSDGDVEPAVDVQSDKNHVWEEYIESIVVDVNSNSVSEISVLKEAEHSDQSKHQSSTESNPTTSVVTKKVKVLFPKSSDKITQMKSISFKCDHCDKSFNHKRTMLRHVNEVHLAGFQMFVCDSCNSAFSRKESLLRHHLNDICVKDIVPAPNYECKNCKRGFDSPNKLKEHGRKNCGKKFFCNTCLTFFKLKKDFLTHSH